MFLIMKYVIIIIDDLNKWLSLIYNLNLIINTSTNNKASANLNNLLKINRWVNGVGLWILLLFGTSNKLPVAEHQMIDMWKEPHIYKTALLILDCDALWRIQIFLSAHVGEWRHEQTYIMWMWIWIWIRAACDVRVVLCALYPV